MRGALESSHRDGRVLLEGADPSNRVRLGQVFTPPDVAQFMAVQLGATWESDVLDIGAGAGILAKAVIQTGASPSRVTLVEKDEALVAHLRADPMLDSCKLEAGDFIAWAERMMREGRMWDRIIANPPYVNFHNYDRSLSGRLNTLLGTRLTAYTNLFAWFMLLAERLLRPGGRLVFIIPTELLSTNYGKATLRHVTTRRRLESVTVFDPGAEPFDGTDTSACIAVVRDGQGTTLVRRVHERASAWQAWACEDGPALATSQLIDRGNAIVTGVEAPVSKATHVPLGDLLLISRGIATGANDFFVLTQTQRRDIDPEGRFTVPVLSRAAQVRDLSILTDSDVERLSEAGEAVWLLDIDGAADLPPALDQHIRAGAARSIGQRFLCKVRQPWYVMEQQDPPLAFLRVFGRDGLRAVPNHSGARTLACFHRMRGRPDVALSQDDIVLLCAWLQSSHGAASAAHQFRRYGGGLLKLEPSDAKRIVVPDLRLLDARTRSRLALQYNRARSQVGAKAAGEVAATELEAALTHAHAHESRP